MSDVSHFEHEAQAARDRILDAVEQLSERLSPQTLLREARAEGRKAVLEVRDDGMRALIDVRDRAADALDEVERSIVANPLAYGAAAAMIGIAATTGMRVARGGTVAARTFEVDEYAGYGEGDSYAADTLRPGGRGSRLKAGAASVRDAAADARDRAGIAVASARDAISDVTARASAAVGDARETARARLSEAGDFVSATTAQAGDRIAAGLDVARDRASDAARSASEAARAGAARAGDAIEENPEAAVLLAFAAGALLALAANRSEDSR